MKVSLFLVAALALAGFSAHADDGGVMGILVKDLQMYSVDATDSSKTTKIDQPSFKIELSGGEAAKLMRVMPADQSVLTNMWPKFKKTFEANFRTLAITQGDNKPTLSISCQGGELNFDDKGKPSLAPFKDGAKCTVTVAPTTNEDDNIDYHFNPEKNICHN